MIRLVFRLLATLALAGAVGAAIVDGAKSLAAETLRLTPLGTTLITAAPKLFTPYFRALAAPDAGLGQRLALWALSTPTAAVLAVAGVRAVRSVAPARIGLRPHGRRAIARAILAAQSVLWQKAPAF